jgi:hypothetical protein
VFGNRVLRKIIRTKKDEATGEWKRLTNEMLYDLYCSPNIIQVIKSRRTKWVGHVARMEMHTRCWWGDLRKRYHFEDLGLCGEIILKWIFKKWGGRHGLDWFGSGWGQITCAFEWGIQHSGFIKSGEFPF